MGLYNFLGTVLLGLSSSAPRSARLHILTGMFKFPMGKIIADSAKRTSCNVVPVSCDFGAPMRMGGP